MDQHIPAKIIADAATSPRIRRAAISTNIALTPSRSELIPPGGVHCLSWCNVKTYKTAAAAAALLCNPANMMEIGVRRGHCLATVAAIQPNISIVGFDVWNTAGDYGGEPNPGPDFVRQELRRVMFNGSLQLFTGRSQDTVPAFRAAFPTTRFDLVCIDGSHETEDAKQDLEHGLALLAVDGVLIFDDICHPDHPELLDVWRTASNGYERHEVTGTIYGFGILRKT